jgi:hypothetical protein
VSTGEQVDIFVGGKEISTVTSRKFLGALVTNGYTKGEIKRRISLGKAAMANVKNCERLGSFGQNKS